MEAIPDLLTSFCSCSCYYYSSSMWSPEKLGFNRPKWKFTINKLLLLKL